MKNQALLTEKEIIDLANEIKAAQKAKAEKVEKERYDKVIALLDTLSDLQPETSESIKKDLCEFGKKSDFSDFFILKYKDFTNVLKYDGEKLVIFKEDGTISAKNLPYKVFINRYSCNWGNMYKDCEVLYTLNEKSPLDLFCDLRTKFMEKYRTFGTIDLNLSEVVKKKLQIDALNIKIKTIKKAERKSKK